MARLHHLDVLRGVAMLGILPVNAPFFALPVALADDPGYVSGDAIHAYVAHYATQILFEYKFITLFSLLFGMGIALMHRSAARRGDSFAGVMLRRLFVLWALGVLHATLLWYGDIVSVYAPMGLVLCWMVTLRPRTLAIIGGAFLLLPVAVLGLLAGFQALAELAGLWDGIPAGAPVYDANAAWGEFLRTCLQAGWAEDPDFESAVFRDGSFGRITVLRTTIWMWSLPAYLLYFAARIGGLFLLGMAAVRAGWFDDLAAGAHRFRRAAIWGLGVGLPLQVAAAALPFWFSGDQADNAAELLKHVGSLGMAAGYAGVVCLVVGRFGAARWLAPLAAVGRTAFSNYVLQSVSMNLVFYSYGLAAFGSMDRAELWIVVVVVWVVELAASVVWMRWFRLGPLEWFWRCLTYWRRLPLRAPAA